MSFGVFDAPEQPPSERPLPAKLEAWWGAGGRGNQIKVINPGACRFDREAGELVSLGEVRVEAGGRRGEGKGS